MICYPKFQIYVKVGQHCAQVELCQTLRKDGRFAKPIESRGSTKKVCDFLNQWYEQESALGNATPPRHMKLFKPASTTLTIQKIEYIQTTPDNPTYFNTQKRTSHYGVGLCKVGVLSHKINNFSLVGLLQKFCFVFFFCCCLLSLGGRSSAIFAYSFFLVLNILQLCTTPQHQHIHTYTQRPPTYATTQLFFFLFACFPLFSFSFSCFVYEPDFSKLLLENIQVSTISLSLNGAILEAFFMQRGE